MVENELYGYCCQAEDSHERVEMQQNSPIYRLTHPSLHHYVWDSRPDIRSASIVLACAQGVMSIIHNLLEFWGCIIFQSFPASERAKYLPTHGILPHLSWTQSCESLVARLCPRPTARLSGQEAAVYSLDQKCEMPRGEGLLYVIVSRVHKPQGL
ncbi:hypothetical protein GQ53DRAFT_458026 [Thozetella sp. PMI_491]|nr:hypothetical protein GQ53DRAFT_458026 [Thozetella sp. PMI_491]